MKSNFEYKRYVVRKGDTLTIEHTEDIVSEEPHPNNAEILVVWTRETDYGTLGFGEQADATTGDGDE